MITRHDSRSTSRRRRLTLFVSVTSLFVATGAFSAEHFDRAHQQFQRGRSLQRLHQNTDRSKRAFAVAYEGYLQSLEQNPSGALAARALYMSGSTKLFLGEPREAIRIYRRVASDYPQDRYYTAKSLLRAAVVEKNILAPDAARATLAEYRRKFPQGAPRNLDKEAGRIENGLAFVGKPAPVISASRWINGSASRESETRPSLTALYFFATWCPNCRKEVGFMIDFQERFQERGIRLVGVTNHSRGQTDEIVEAYVVTNELRFPVAIDQDGKTFRTFGGRSVPTLVLVDHDRVIRWHDHPAALDYAVVERLLEESNEQ